MSLCVTGAAVFSKSHPLTLTSQPSYILINILILQSALLASRDSVDEAEAEVEVLPFYTVKLSTQLTAQVGRAAFRGVTCGHVAS